MFSSYVDNKNHPYIEIEVQPDIDCLRITYVEDSFLTKPSVRFQIHPYGKT